MEFDQRGVKPLSFLQEHILLCILLFAGLATCLWLFLLRKRLGMPGFAALLLAPLHVLLGVFCVKAFAVLEGNPLEQGAMSLFGAIFFLPLAYWLGAKLSKRSTAAVFDIFAICMIFTLLCARVNCLFAGCCLGREIPGADGLRWPTRELELVFYLAFLLCTAPQVWKGKSYGQVYPLFMLAYGIFRSIVECFRVSATNNLFHLSHVWALVSVAVGAAFYAELRRSREQKKSRRRA